MMVVLRTLQGPSVPPWLCPKMALINQSARMRSNKSCWRKPPLCRPCKAFWSRSLVIIIVQHDIALLCIPMHIHPEQGTYDQQVLIG